jgi:hypothetical protein
MDQTPCPYPTRTLPAQLIFANFCLLGDCLLWEILFENYIRSQYEKAMYFFRGKKYGIYFDK